jgi:hypothetical protein
MTEEQEKRPFYMVMLVLHRIALLDAVLDAWRAIGIGGATIVESVGLYRRQRQRKRLPLRFPFEQGLPQEEERGQYTIFAVVPDEMWVQRCLEAAESVTGNLDEPQSGIFASWPLGQCKGVFKGIRPKEER